MPRRLPRLPFVCPFVHAFMIVISRVFSFRKSSPLFIVCAMCFSKAHITKASIYAKFDSQIAGLVVEEIASFCERQIMIVCIINTCAVSLTLRQFIGAF